MVTRPNMHTKLEEQKKARGLRKLGFSVKDIAKKLKVSSSSVSLWVRGVVISESGQAKLLATVQSSRQKGLQVLKEGRELQKKALLEKVKRDFGGLSNDPRLCRLLCSFLYWGEGSKTGHSVSFINSDPIMIETFLFLFRKGFSPEEAKFRCLVHIHEYHDETKIKQFWSDITNIPTEKFQRSYLKPNSKKILRVGYMGSLVVKYYDSSIFNQIKVSYLEFFNQHVRGVG